MSLLTAKWRGRLKGNFARFREVLRGRRSLMLFFEFFRRDVSPFLFLMHSVSPSVQHLSDPPKYIMTLPRLVSTSYAKPRNTSLQYYTAYYTIVGGVPGKSHVCSNADETVPRSATVLFLLDSLSDGVSSVQFTPSSTISPQVESCSLG